VFIVVSLSTQSGNFWIQPRIRKVAPVTKHHASKAYEESGAKSSCILNLSTRCIWVVSFTLRPLYPIKHYKGSRAALGL